MPTHDEYTALVAFVDDCSNVAAENEQLRTDAAVAEATLEQARALEEQVTERLTHERKAAHAEIEAVRQAKVDAAILDATVQAKIRRVSEDLANGHQDEIRAEVAEELDDLRAELRQAEHEARQSTGELAVARQELGTARRQVEDLQAALKAASDPEALRDLLLKAGQV